MRARGAVAVVVVLVAGCRGGKKSGHAPLAAGGAPVTTTDGIVEDAFSYDVKTWTRALDAYDVTIEDVGMTRDLEGVLGRTGADLVVNGGFFDEQGKPLGLTMSNGVQLSGLTKKLSGGVLVVDASAQGRLFATESYAPPEGVRFAVQCRPRLVVGGQPNVRSDDGKRSERTALCLRDGGKTLEIDVVRGGDGGPSLYALGRWLAGRGCEDALNLDGGPSTGAAWLEEGDAQKKVIAPRGPIRQAIVFKKKT